MDDSRQCKAEEASAKTQAFDHSVSPRAVPRSSQRCQLPICSATGTAQRCKLSLPIAPRRTDDEEDNDDSSDEAGHSSSELISPEPKSSRLLRLLSFATNPDSEDDCGEPFETKASHFRAGALRRDFDSPSPTSSKNHCHKTSANGLRELSQSPKNFGSLQRPSSRTMADSSPKAGNKQLHRIASSGLLAMEDGPGFAMDPGILDRRNLPTLDLKRHGHFCKSDALKQVVDEDALSGSDTARQLSARVRTPGRSASLPQLPKPSPQDPIKTKHAHGLEGVSRDPLRGCRRSMVDECYAGAGCSPLSDCSTTDLQGSLSRFSLPSPVSSPCNFPEQSSCTPRPACPPANNSCTSSLLKRRLASSLAIDTTARERTRKEITLLEPGEKIFDFYAWDTVLQEEGDGGKVVICRLKGTPKTPSSPCDKKHNYVMKMRSKESLDEDSMSGTFRKLLLRMLNMPPHSGVLPIHEVLEDDKFYYIVMEEASGGPFFLVLLSQFGETMPADAVRNVIRETLEALGYIHSQGLLHRDVKPDNLVFQKCHDPQSPTGKVHKVALIDFDHADPEWKADQKSKPKTDLGWCGTVRFSAPETFSGRFSQASDLYSVGVILYMLLTGNMPYSDSLFLDVSDKKYDEWKGILTARMKTSPIDWTADVWDTEPLSRNFCQRLLAFDPAGRPASADEALQDPWFRNSQGHGVF